MSLSKYGRLVGTMAFSMQVVLLFSLQVEGQTGDLPTENSSLFTGSGNCAFCHNSGGSSALRDSQGNDLSIGESWRSTMMANAARDPFWQAKVESEVNINPQLQTIIEDKCTTCHGPMGKTQALFDGATSYSLDDMRNSVLGMDGVSCTLCHQIQPDNLGTDESFSGGFIIDSSRVIFGPYQNVLANPMRNAVNYDAVFGAHLQTSEVCATCHTLFTPFLDNDGNIAGELPEQTPYLEWQNSTFSADGTQCQDCHMPRVEEPVVISNIPPMLSGQSPFWRHLFVGGNAFMLEILRDNGVEIGVTASAAHFDSTIALTRRQLRQNTALLELESTVENDTLKLMVTVENLTGHKFPTAYPSRRAWLHLSVRNDAGGVLFESGSFNASNGRIDGLTDSFQPHLDTINSQDQVQVYESVMADVNGDVTQTLLRGASYIKDNRIPPKGFLSTADNYADMAIKGAAARDGNFNHDAGGEGSGSDVVTYRVNVSGLSGLFTITVDLLYQSINPVYIDDLVLQQTPAVTRFKGYYDNADKTPELIQSIQEQVLVTDVAENSPELPTGFALQQNYPNPFNAGTVIMYEIPANAGSFELSIYDIQGRYVRSLVSGTKSPGSYTAVWNGQDDRGQEVSSGVYVYRLSTGAQNIARKLIYLK